MYMATNRRPTSWGREDRDLLIELRTEMSAVRDDIKQLKDNLSTRVQQMEVNKLDKIEADKRRDEVMGVIETLQADVSSLKRYQLILSTLAGAAGAILTAAINLFGGTIRL